MNIIADILEAWPAATEAKGRSREAIATLLDNAAEEATGCAEVASVVVNHGGFDYEEHFDAMAKMNGHCSALFAFYKGASSVIPIHDVKEVFIFQLAEIHDNRINILRTRDGSAPFRPPRGGNDQQWFAGIDAQIILLNKQAGELRAFAALYRASIC